LYNPGHASSSHINPPPPGIELPSSASGTSVESDTHSGSIHSTHQSHSFGTPMVSGGGVGSTGQYYPSLTSAHSSPYFHHYPPPPHPAVGGGPPDTLGSSGRITGAGEGPLHAQEWNSSSTRHPYEEDHPYAHHSHAHTTPSS